ncbi:Uncharacterised protein [Streptococcus pneumoniae]|nr:Uncharacterised protein [Streptococcus pneumoniae]CKF34546.1 Uncharacterised protein [Streptococcus pneumoniae]
MVCACKTASSQKRLFNKYLSCSFLINSFSFSPSIKRLKLYRFALSKVRIKEIKSSICSFVIELILQVRVVFILFTLF